MAPSQQQTVTRGVRLVGAGAYVPERAVDNERIATAIPGWSPERIEEKMIAGVGANVHFGGQLLRL